MKLAMLKKHTVDSITSKLAEIVEAHSLTNVFNPSVVEKDGTTFIAFRAESRPGERPFRAYLATYRGGSAGNLVDLSAIAAEHGVKKAADPKLVSLHDEIYVTFNTGNVHTGQNAIYLQRITPTIGALQRCELVNRRMVEKNWGFYTLPGGDLCAIYSLAPLVLMRRIGGELGSTDVLAFAREEEISTHARFPRLHIGSQPLIISPSRAIVAANQQVPIPGIPRKIYFGRMAELDLESGQLIRLSRHALLHSPSSALPQISPHNPGLLSATYFSGLTLANGLLTASYGVNDKSYGVAAIDRASVWG